MDWLDLLAVKETLKSLLQYHSSEASILQCSAFFIFQLSHPYMTTVKSIALMTRIFVGKVMSLLFNMLSRLVITFLPRSKRLLISLVIRKMQIRSTTRYHQHLFSSVQFSSVAESCPTLCDPMNHSTPGLPVHHQLLEFTQTHIH